MDRDLYELSSNAHSLAGLRANVAARIEAQPEAASGLAKAAFQKASVPGLPVVALKMLIVLCEAARLCAADAVEDLAEKAAIVLESVAQTRFKSHGMASFSRVPRDAAVRASLRNAAGTRTALMYIAQTCSGNEVEPFLKAFASAAFEADDEATATALLPCLSKASSEQFNTLVAPACSRALKLRTEKTLPLALKMIKLLKIPPSEEAIIIPALKAIGTSSKDKVQMEAAELLGIAFSLLPDATPRRTVFDQVFAALKSETAPSRRLALCSALGWMRTEGMDDVPPLLLKRALEDKSEDGRAGVLEALARWAPFATPLPEPSPPTLVTGTLAALRFVRVAPLSTWPNVVAQVTKIATGEKDEAKRLFALDALAGLDAPLPGGVDAALLVQKTLGDSARRPSLLRILGKLDSPLVALLLGTECRTEAKHQVERLNRPVECLAALAKADKFNSSLALFALDAVLGPHPPASCAGVALVAAHHLGGRLAWKTISKRFHAHDVKKHALDCLDELLASAASNRASADALETACRLSEHGIPADRLKSVLAKLEPLTPLTDVEAAAWNAPPGLTAQSLRSEEGDEDADGDDGEAGGKIRLMRQGRKGRGGARKDVYSAETEEWERKVKQEQLERARREQSKSGPAPFDLAAYKREEEMRARLRIVQREYVEACKVLSLVCAASPVTGASISATVVRLARQGRLHSLSAVAASNLLDAVLLACLNNDVAHVEVLRPLRRLLFEGRVSLDAVRQTCEDNGPMTRELWAFVHPVVLAALRTSSDKDELLSAATLASIHAASCIDASMRLDYLDALLRVASPQSARAVEDLFTPTSPPNDAETQVLSGDLGLLHGNVFIRRAALVCLALRQDTTLLVWFARSDADEDLRTMADATFSEMGQMLPDDVTTPLLPLLSHTSAAVRAQAARALAFALDEQTPDLLNATLDKLLQLYRDHLPVKRTLKAEDVKPKFVVREGDKEFVPKQDPHLALRMGVCQVLDAMTKDESAILDEHSARRTVEFVLEYGTRDDDAIMREAFLACGLGLLKTYSEDLGQGIFPVIQSFVDGRNAKLSHDPAQADLQKQGAIVLLGAAAGSLDPADERVPECIRALVGALRTPSERVQRAVAQCLPGLVKAPSIVQDSGPLVLGLLEKVYMGKSFGERRGAAMGLASVVKGLGLASLKQHQVVARIVAEAESPQWEHREGSLLCVEELCQALGRLFEPYLVQTLEPVLLRGFSDAAQEVRDAAHDASKLVMANLSGPGVSMILPKLLSGIQSDQWRTKHAAISMLGAVAFCAPKQLGTSLPQVVPRLIDAFSDTHIKVRQAGIAAIRDVSSVIKNPEIQTLSPVLLGALVDPHENTHKAVEELFKTRFVNTIDVPSLSLLVPVLLRGLKERSTETKKHSALIIGNMLSMVGDAKAVGGYMEELLPVLKDALFDPIPGVRGTAARAIGSLTKGLGPEGIPGFADLLSFLVDGSRAGSSSVERQGGAQGLVEVLVALGSPRLEDGLESEVFARVRDPDARAREGALWALVFLPSALDRPGMLPLLGRALGCALDALGDDAEPVRDAAHRAGRVYVTQFAESDPKQVIVPLQAGLESLSWRVRQSAVRLVGDVVCKLVKGSSASSVSQELVAQGMNTGEEPPEDALSESEGSSDEDEGGEAEGGADGNQGESEGPADAAMLRIFGAERRDLIIARLYLLRGDASGPVRQTALFVWKGIVSNTPRTLRRIVRPLMQCIIQGLSDNSTERQQVAGKTLGDIVRKLGQRVLGQIVPVVVQGLDSERVEERRGVALGLQEMVASASKKDLEPHAKELLGALLRALCDNESDVRESAGKSFARIHSALGGDEALALVVTPLVNLLESPERRDSAVLGLQQAVFARSKDVMAFLLPSLLVRPISEGRALALAMACECVVAHGDFYVRLVLRPLASELVASGSLPAPDSVQWQCASRVVRALGYEERGLGTLMPELVDLIALPDDGALRCSAMALTGALFAPGRKGASLDLHVPLVLKTIIRLFADADSVVLAQAVSTLAVVLRSAGNEQAAGHIDYMRNSIRTVASMDKHRSARGSTSTKDDYVLPAFALSGALEALLDVYIFALANGTSEAKESGAQGMGELVDLCSSATLKPYVVKMAGPLIRIVGDRLPGSVKTAILDALRKLLVKGGAVLKPFLPQLQTTFVKSLQNSVDSVRSMGLLALEEMVPLLPRVDLLVNEFVQGVSTGTDAGVRADMLRALLFVLVMRSKDVSVWGKITDPASPVAAAVADWQDAGVRTAAAACEAAALLQSRGEFQSDRLRKAEQEGADWPTRHGALLSLNACLRCGCRIGEDYGPALANALEDESASVRAVAADACGWAKRLDLLNGFLSNEDSAGVRALASKSMSEKRESGLAALLGMSKELAGNF